MNGKFIRSGRIETYPLRVPMPLSARAAVMTTGIKVAAAVARYARVVRQRPGESAASRQQRIYDFENERSFADFVGDLPADAAALFKTTVTRSAGEMDEISAGAGIGYFGMIWNIGQGGLNRGIVGGPSTLTEAVSVALGDRVELGAEVQEIVNRPDSVVVRYRQDGIDREVEARCVVLATPATVAHRVAVDLPTDVRDALGKVVYGPHVSAAFLTDETSAAPLGRLLRHRLPQALVRHRAQPGEHRPGHRVRSSARRQPDDVLPGPPGPGAAGLLRRGDRPDPPGRPRPGAGWRLRRLASSRPRRRGGRTARRTPSRVAASCSRS